MYERLVPTIAAEQDAGRAAARHTIGRDPGRERCFPRTADGQIPDCDRRQGEAHGVGAAPGCSKLHDRPVRAREGDERHARHSGGPGATPQPVQHLGRRHASMLPCRLADPSFPPWVTACSARSATVIPRRSASFPSATPNGAL